MQKHIDWEHGISLLASLRGPSPQFTSQVPKTASKGVAKSERLPAAVRQHAGHKVYLYPRHAVHTQTQAQNKSSAALHLHPRNKRSAQKKGGLSSCSHRRNACRAHHSPSWLRALLATSTLRRSANASLAIRSRSPVDKSISDWISVTKPKREATQSGDK